MDSERAPRAWIGEEVQVYFSGDRLDDEASDHLYRLIDVGPEGIVVERSITVEEDDDAYEGTAHVLIPWHGVKTVNKIVGIRDINAQAEDAE